MQFNNKVYDVLKWICLIFIPALATFLGVLLPQIGISMDITTTVITIVTAVGTFIGALIGISNATYSIEGKKK